MDQLKRTARRCFAVYAALCLLAVAVFYIAVSGSDAMAFSLIFFYMTLPGAALVLSAVMCAHGLPARSWAMTAIGFGAMMMLTDWLTYKLSNMLAFGAWRWPDIEALMFGFIASLIGSAVGMGVRELRK